MFDCKTVSSQVSFVGCRVHQVSQVPKDLKMVSFSSEALTTVGSNGVGVGTALIGPLASTAAMVEALREDCGDQGLRALAPVTPVR